MNSQAILSEIWVYPVKSCAGVSLRQSLLTEAGLEWDRCWMVVDAQGHMVSQRDIPTMALITPRFRAGDVVLRAPGMLALHLALDQAEGPTQVEVWGDTLPAYDMGDLAAQWVTDFLSQTPAGRAIESIETPAPDKVVIKLKQTFGPFLLSLACEQGGAILPDMMRWLWRDHAVSTDVRDMVERSLRPAVQKQ